MLHAPIEDHRALRTTLHGAAAVPGVSLSVERLVLVRSETVDPGRSQSGRADLFRSRLVPLPV